MNDTDARIFVRNLLTEIFENNNKKLLAKYYAHDVIGHTNDTIFNFQDVENRIDYLHARYKHLKYYIIGAFSLAEGSMILSHVRISAYDIKLANWCGLNLVATYLLQNNLVKELWLMLNMSLDYSATIDDLAKNISPQEKITIDSLEKKNFDLVLHNSQQYNKNCNIKLTVREHECLFYFLKGFAAKEIARVLNLSHRTVEDYIASSKDKYNCSSKYELRKKLFTIEK